MSKCPTRFFVLETLLLIIALLSTHYFAGAADNQGLVFELNLNQAIELALKQNADFYLIALDLEQAQAAFDRAVLVNDTEMIETAAETQEKQQQSFDNNKRDLIASIRKMYYDLLQQEAAVTNQQKVLYRAETQFEIDQTKYDAGIISSLDIQRSENNLLNAEINYNKETISLETKYLEFNHILGIHLTQKIRLTEQITIEFEPFNMKLEEAYKLALDSDQSIAAADEALSKAIETVKASDNPFTPPVDLEKALVEQEKAQIKLEQAKISLYFKIRSDFYSLKNAEEDVHTKARQLKLEQQILQSEEAKYAAGVISNEAVVTQQEKLAQAENAYTQALWNYSQARSSFLVQIGQPEPLWGERL